MYQIKESFQANPLSRSLGAMHSPCNTRTNQFQLSVPSSCILIALKTASASCMLMESTLISSAKASKSAAASSSKIWIWVLSSSWSKARSDYFEDLCEKKEQRSRCMAVRTGRMSMIPRSMNSLRSDTRKSRSSGELTMALMKVRHEICAKTEPRSTGSFHCRDGYDIGRRAKYCLH